MPDDHWITDDEDWHNDDDGEPEDAMAADGDAVPCPECGATLYDDADHCPQCGYWITEADRRAASPGSAKSKAVKIVAAVLLVMFLVSLLIYGTIF
jgi:hypothetical protein